MTHSLFFFVGLPNLAFFFLLQSDVNPELMKSFMSLMADYVRLHLMVYSVGERKQALGMYYCAYSTVHGKKIGAAMAKVSHELLVLLLVRCFHTDGSFFLVS